MEGFNNKIRWLIKQAYGFRDRKYFKLNISVTRNFERKKVAVYGKKRRRDQKNIEEALIMSDSAEWWVMRDSNSRHSRCKRDALTN